MPPTSASFSASHISCWARIPPRSIALQATIALGDSPYLEDAHWYLAKAFLRRKDLGAAEDAFEDTHRASWDRER